MANTKSKSKSSTGAHACIEPTHHVHDAAGFVHAVEHACHERGLRLTAIRARVLGLVAAAGKPIKAYDLLELVRGGEGAGAAAPPTVYRALDFLLANGFIHKLESVNAFVACHHPSTDQLEAQMGEACQVRGGSVTRQRSGAPGVRPTATLRKRL